jgi:hypothetical protein
MVTSLFMFFSVRKEKLILIGLVITILIACGRREANPLDYLSCPIISTAGENGGAVFLGEN